MKVGNWGKKFPKTFLVDLSLSSTINSSLIDTMNHESKSAFFVGWNKRKARPNSQATSTQSNTLPSPNQRLSGHQTTSVHWKEAPQKSECYQFINGYDYKTPPNFLWFATLNLPHVKLSYIYTLRYPIRSELQTKTNGAKGVKNSPKEMVTWASQTLWKRGRSNGCGFVVASASNQIHEFMNRKITIGNAPPRTILLYAMGDIMGW